MHDASASGASTLSPEILTRLACPVCRGGLAWEGGQILCKGCQRRYPVQDGIPVLIAERGTQGK